MNDWLSILLAAALAAAPSNWAGWRGEGTGISTETDVPTEWGDGKNIKWKAPIPGRGHSQPIVWGRHVFLTTETEGPVVAGAKPVEHVLGGEKFKHPDSVGGGIAPHRGSGAGAAPRRLISSGTRARA